ncbi:MAG: hypothetical protein WDM89_08315 [Rhizomicrobium sp.]
MLLLDLDQALNVVALLDGGLEFLPEQVAVPDHALGDRTQQVVRRSLELGQVVPEAFERFGAALAPLLTPDADLRDHILDPCYGDLGVDDGPDHETVQILLFDRVPRSIAGALLETVGAAVVAIHGAVLPGSDHDLHATPAEPTFRDPGQEDLARRDTRGCAFRRILLQHDLDTLEVLRSHELGNGNPDPLVARPHDLLLGIGLVVVVETGIAVILEDGFNMARVEGFALVGIAMLVQVIDDLLDPEMSGSPIALQIELEDQLDE